MKIYIFLFFLFSFFHSAQGQNVFKAVVQDSQSKEPLPGVNGILINSKIGGSSNEDGRLIINNIPDGEHTILFSSIGYKNRRITLQFPLQNDDPVIVRLQPDQHELEQVVVNALRGSRNIEDIPTRVEVITEEELGEKAVMNSTNIAMLLRESTGILVQQTNPNSANASIRIQGLDGRYTQILRDGFPLYSGFAGGLSIMQIPPLDLHQVEVIKGSASTLYGGGAIAGLINLVSKTPEEEPELSLMLNQTTALGTTLNGFYAEDFGKTGVTIYASGNHQTPYDPNNDGFTAIPKIRSISLNPRLFYKLNDKASFNFGINSILENRIGGDILAINNNENSPHLFTETNVSERVSSQFQFDKIMASGKFTLKNSINYFNRKIEIPSFIFSGLQWATFSEASYAHDRKNSDWIIGGNIYSDSFEDKEIFSPAPRDYSHYTYGIFLQNNTRFHHSFNIESGLRTDFNNQYGTFFLPRISALFRINPEITARLGGGMGYKIPTIFTEEAERRIFQNILPINPENVMAERSIGGNFDLNYKTSIGDDFFFTINQLFFYTQLENSLVLNDPPASNFSSFENADGPVNSSGFETNIKFSLYDFKLFFNYAYINTQLNYENINHQKPLTPKHNAGATLMYEDGKWIIGYEIYYTGNQYLSDFTPTPDFWMMGFMVLRNFNRFSIFLNFENFTDTRQSRFQPMVYPPLHNPTFPEIWAPTDGFIANGGIKINLL